MGDYDYGNTRLRVMKSRLLSRRVLEDLSKSPTVEALITALSQTGYRKPVEDALVLAGGVACVIEAVHQDLLSTLKRVRSFYPGDAGRMVERVFLFIDVQNLKLVLRGAEKHAPAQTVRAALLPVGALSDVLLTELLHAPDPRHVIDLLATLRVDCARPLLRIREERPGATLADMELALDRWLFQGAANDVDSDRPDPALAAAYRLEADLANLRTVLRLAAAPSARNGPSPRVDRRTLAGMLVGPGNLAEDLLLDAGTGEHAAAAVDRLAQTEYGAALREGLEEYRRSGSLNAFERRLVRHRLAWMAAQMRADPLGIGLPLGFTALKCAEANNVRWIAQAIDAGLDPGAIRTGLEVAE